MLRDDYEFGVRAVGQIRVGTRQNPAYLTHPEGFALTFAFLHTARVWNLNIVFGIGDCSDKRFDVPRACAAGQREAEVFLGFGIGISTGCRQRTAADVVALEVLRIA